MIWLLIIFGCLIFLVGAALLIAGADANDEGLAISGIFVAVIGVLMVLGGMGAFKEDPECEEYGTVMVIVDGDKRCVPWDQAPDLQDFPQP